MQGLADFLWSGEAEMTDLVQGLDLGVPGRAFGHHQCPDGFHVAVLVLGAPSWRWPWAARAASMASTVSFLPLRRRSWRFGSPPRPPPPPRAQVPGQAGPVRARAFHPDPGHRAEPGHPFQQLLVALYRCRERLDAQQPTDLVHHGSHVQFQVGVNATSNRARGTYDCHVHPFLFKFWFGMAPPPPCGRVDRPVPSRAIRHTPTTAPPPRTWPTNCSPADKLTVSQLSKARPRQS